MERGLLWLPLLVLFFWLAWAGWNDYQKVEAYRVWAQDFQRSKYDIYAVLGERDRELVWGKPTRQGPINLQSFSLEQVRSIDLLVNDQVVDLQAPPAKGRSVALQFVFRGEVEPVRVPFTEISLAAEWAQHLQQELALLQS